MPSSGFAWLIVLLATSAVAPLVAMMLAALAIVTPMPSGRRLAIALLVCGWCVLFALWIAWSALLGKSPLALLLSEGAPTVLKVLPYLNLAAGAVLLAATLRLWRRRPNEAG